MNVLTNKFAKNICESGGVSTTCLPQIPFTIDGYDEYGFAFAVIPGEGTNVCGRCFELSFIGEGKWETYLITGHKPLKFSCSLSEAGVVSGIVVWVLKLHWAQQSQSVLM